MEGQGVANYAVDKPSYAISTSTTQFDDELIRRGIVSFEDAMVAKGATRDEAHRLGQVRQGNATPNDAMEGTVEPPTGEDEDSDDFNDDDDEFMVRYRQERLRQLKQSSKTKQNSGGHVIPISREDWSWQVNEASEKRWVAVVLTSNDAERTGCVESAAAQLAPKHEDLTFVSIPYRAAIANWPEENLPTVFFYRHGKLQHQILQLPISITAHQLQRRMAELGIVDRYEEESETETDETKKTRRHWSSPRNGYSSGMARFGGSMERLHTRPSVHDSSDDEEAY